MDQIVLKPGVSCLVHRVSKKISSQHTHVRKLTLKNPNFLTLYKKSEDLATFRWNTCSSFALTDPFYLCKLSAWKTT